MLTAIKRAVTGLVRAVIGLAIVAGTPLMLSHYTGNPVASLLTQLARLPAEPIATPQPATFATLVVWLLWALVTVAFAVEAAARARGVAVPRLPMLRPAQGLAAALLASQAAGLLSPAVPAQAVAAAHSFTSAAPPTLQPTAPRRSVTGNDTPHALNSVMATSSAPTSHRWSTYRVVKGDSLWRIAQRYLGDPERWPEIWQLNKGKHWPHVSGHTKFSDPDVIFPGWVLTLPADATVPPDAKPVDPPSTKPPVATSPPVTQTPSSPASPNTQQVPPSTSASPSATPSGHDDSGDGVYMPPSQLPGGSPSLTAPTSAPVAPSVTPSASGSRSPSATGSDEAPSAGPLDGLDLPGGWLALGLGAALLAAAGRVWLRRRHRYTAIPITTPVLDDADLTPPLAASTRIRQALRRAQPDTPDEPVQVPTVREYNAAQVKPALPPVGPSGAHLAGAATLPLSAGLGLTGGGAHDAARAMLVAVLSSGTLDDPDAQGRAIIPATTLATLLAVSAVELGPIPRLTIAASMAEAMTILEEEIIRRSRIIAEQEVADVAALRQTEAYAEPLPQLLLIADTPDPVWQKRLATAIGLGETVDIGAVLLGVWPHGTTLDVASDGNTIGGGEQRLAVLDTDNAAGALTMLHEAYADQPLTPPAVTAAPSAPSRSLVDDLLEPEPVADEATLDQATAPGTDAAGRRVQVQVLGVPGVLDATGQPVQKLRAKSIELLVYLAVNRAGAPLAQIMEALWPDATWRRASERLSTCVANLRHAIRGVLADTNPDDTTDHKRVEPVVNSGGHYRLDPAIVDVDWWTVLDAYAHVAHSGDDAARLAHLKTAIDAIGGGLATGADYEWADTDRETVRRHQIKIYVHAADLVADDDPHQSRVLLDTACEIDPLSEDLAQRAIRAAAALGDADAIRHRLRTLRQALDSHGIDIAPATEQLAKDLLRKLIRNHRTDP